MKICFNKTMVCQGIEVRHSDNTGKDYSSIKLLDKSNGEFIKINCTDQVASMAEDLVSYNVQVRAEGFFDKEKNVSGYRLFCYNIEKLA